MSKKVMLKHRKQHFLLLEVLIAIFLIVLCMIPLIYPHTYILVSQKRFVHQVELDHAVNLIYADIIEKLYTNDISWNAIISKTEFEVDDSFLESANIEGKLPFKGTYRFGETIHKPKKDPPDKPYWLYLLTLDLTFTPEYKVELDEDGKIPTFKYHYDIVVVRDLSLGEGGSP